MSNVVKLIDEAIEILEKLDKEYIEVYSSHDISNGKKFEIYQLLVDLRERLSAARILAAKTCR